MNFPTLPPLCPTPSNVDRIADTKRDDDTERDTEGDDDAQRAHRLYQSAIKATERSKWKHRVVDGSDLLARWKRTPRRCFWRLDRRRQALDQFREAARIGGPVIAMYDSRSSPSKQSQLEAFSTLVRVAELFSRRLGTARRPDWAIELLVDALRGARDLRRGADWVQLKLAIESEMHLMRQLRATAARRRIHPDLLERTVRSADEVFGEPMERSELLASEYDRRTEPRFRGADDDADVPPRELLRRGMYQCLIWAAENGVPTQELFEVIEREVRFRFPSSFAQQHDVPDDAQWSDLVDENLRREWVDLFQMSRHMDARDAAAAATRSYLCVAAYHRRLGFYPVNLETACDEFEVATPTDSFSTARAPVQLRLAGGERIRGPGVDTWKGKVHTKLNQPLIYSVGPDGANDNGSIAWDGTLQGAGDWIFPLPAHRRPRHLLQFDLRKALIGMTLACIYVAYFTSGPARQRRAVQRIYAEGGSVEYSNAAENSFQSLIQYWFGQERFGTPRHADLSPGSNLGALLQSMSGFEDLESIGLSSCTVTEGDFLHLNKFSKLRVLYLEGAEVPPKEYANLASFPLLRELHCGDKAIDDEGFKHLPALPRLTSLSVSHTDLTGATFGNLAERFPGVTDLTLYGTKCNDDGLAEVGKLHRLTFLDIDSTSITDAGIAHLRDLVNLVTLDMQRTPVTDASLRHLSKMTKLEGLRLNETKVTGSGFVHLVGLPKLVDISMDGTLLTDKEAPIVAKLTSLTSLSVEGTQLTTKGMRILSTMRADISYPQYPGTWFLDLPNDAEPGSVTIEAPTVPGATTPAPDPF